ncbi:hypothetical protein EBU94_07825 [bacterium]|nr:hypothetical protein [bacterium]
MNIIITETQLSRLLIEQNPFQGPQLSPSLKNQMTNTQVQYAKQPKMDDYKTKIATSDYLGKGGEFERAKPKVLTFEQLKNAKIIRGKKRGSTVEELIEDLKKFVFSPSGIAIEAFLTAWGFTAPAVMGTYAALLGYDIYQAIKGKPNWVDIIFETICVITSGSFASTLAPFRKGGVVAKTLEEFFVWIKGTSLGKTLLPIITKIIGGLARVGEWISYGMKWIAEQTGLQLFVELASSAVSWFKSVIHTIEAGFKELSSVFGAGKQIAVGTGKAAGKYAEEKTIFQPAHHGVSALAGAAH